MRRRLPQSKIKDFCQPPRKRGGRGGCAACSCKRSFTGAVKANAINYQIPPSLRGAKRRDAQGRSPRKYSWGAISCNYCQKHLKNRRFPRPFGARMTEWMVRCKHKRSFTGASGKPPWLLRAKSRLRRLRSARVLGFPRGEAVAAKGGD